MEVRFVRSKVVVTNLRAECFVRNTVGEGAWLSECCL